MSNCPHASGDNKPGKVLSFSPRLQRVVFLDYTQKTIHTNHNKMYKITTSTGHSIKVTDDHSLATVGENNFFKPLPPENSLGSFVPIPFYDITEEDFYERMAGKITNSVLLQLVELCKANDIVIDGGYGGNVPTTIVDCTGDEVEIIRKGKGEILL